MKKHSKIESKGLRCATKKRKRRLLVSAALVASMGMLPQYSNSAQAQSENIKNNITPKCIPDNKTCNKKHAVKMIDKIVDFNTTTNTVTGFAISMPEPTREILHINGQIQTTEVFLSI